jgi:electron transport complex protein RnfC
MILPLTGAETSEECLVQPGTRVAKNTVLSLPVGKEPSYSSVSGTVRQLKSITHPLLGDVICAVVDTDEMKKELRTKPLESNDDEALIKAARSAGIIDEMDSVPLHKKLERFYSNEIDILIVKAFDDEPYITNAQAILKNYAADVLAGMRAVEKVCGAQEVKLAVFHPGRVKHAEVFKDLDENLLIRTKKIYPAWPNLENRLKRKGKSVCVIGLQACAAFGRALRKGEPQTHAIVTVAGSGISGHHVFRVPIGTPVKNLLDECSVKADACRIIMGSPLTGKTVTSQDVPVVASTRAVIVMEEVKKAKKFACIGCGRCAHVCPEHIMPWYVNERMRCDNIDTNKLLNVEKCRQCNACTVVCPSGIRLADMVGQAKTIKEQGALR